MQNILNFFFKANNFVCFTKTNCNMKVITIKQPWATLIAKGYKVAICEQLEDAKATKGIVKRGVIKVITPGTVVESNMLEERKNNYIMSICLHIGKIISIKMKLGIK